jgi:hypothetical protein
MRESRVDRYLKVAIGDLSVTISCHLEVSPARGF